MNPFDPASQKTPIADAHPMKWYRLRPLWKYAPWRYSREEVERSPAIFTGGLEPLDGERAVLPPVQVFQAGRHRGEVRTFVKFEGGPLDGCVLSTSEAHRIIALQHEEFQTGRSDYAWMQRLYQADGRLHFSWQMCRERPAE